jgi:hypothetical protein
MFDIDTFINTWSAGKPGSYLKLFEAASKEELLEFREKVKAHKKQPQKVTFASQITPRGVDKFCIHDDILLRAIRWELIKRSKWKRFFYDLTIPFRQHVGGLWYGADLKETEHFGFVLSYRNAGKTRLKYLGLKKCLINLGKAIWRYWVQHHWQIITALIALLAIYIKWDFFKQ